MVAIKRIKQRDNKIELCFPIALIVSRLTEEEARGRGREWIMRQHREILVGPVVGYCGETECFDE